MKKRERLGARESVARNVSLRVSPRIVLTAFLLSTLAVINIMALAQAQTATRVSGRVVNGTASASPNTVANLAVTLFQMGSSRPITTNTQTDVDGKFSFDRIDTSTPYFLRVEYGGLKYFSDLSPVTMTASAPLTLTIYESMTMPANTKISQMHLIFDVGEKIVQGIQLLVVENKSDKAYLLPLTTPEGASPVSFDDPITQARVQTLPDGRVGYPILPPGEQVAFGYSMLVKPPEHNIKLKLPYPVDTFSLLVSDLNGLKVSSPNLVTRDPFTLSSGQRYLTLSGQSLATNTTVVATISNLPGADNIASAQLVAVVVGGIAGLGLMGWSVLQKRSAGPGSGGDENAARQVELVRSIATLDDAYEARELSQDEYDEQRAELKAELIALMH